MRKTFMRMVLFGAAVWLATADVSKGAGLMKPEWKALTAEETRVIVGKGTEPAFSGAFDAHAAAGVYTCRRCGAALYRSSDKFNAGCGWPAFDAEVPGAVKRVPDADGRRTEIVCATCGGHLGHVFTGERLTARDTRHCVNSLSLAFVGDRALDTADFARAVFAGGCFWGVEYYLQQATGVIRVVSGYTGGTVENPTYQQVCAGGTGHIEAIEVCYDPRQTDYEALARLFFEIHDPTQRDRQGPDIGAQYRSAVFYRDEAQKITAEALVARLRKNGFAVVTEIRPAVRFWPAEAYHQDYYFKKGTTPYCHRPVRRL
jgi:peptide methionine sulfoxide reductase msrA/msrB